MRRLLILTTLLILSTLPVLGAPADIEFDAGIRAQKILGFGANIWPADMNVFSVYKDMKLTWARLWFDPGDPPTNLTREQMDAYWTGYATSRQLPYVIQSADMLKKYGAKTIFTIGNPPGSWLGPGKSLPKERFNDFAVWLVSCMKFYISHGVKIHYVELYNEPDGDWNVHIFPVDNATITKLVRKELDARGLHKIGILGPGLSHLVSDPAGDPMVNAMDEEAVRSLAGWSSHAWEWNSAAVDAEGGQSFVRRVWPYQMASYKRKDPKGRLPIFVTEYCNQANIYHGEPTPKGMLTADRPAFAARVVENTLSLLNGGANVLVYWQGADQTWDPGNAGFIGDSLHKGAPRPVFYAMKAICARLQPDSYVLKPIKQDASIYSAAFIKDNRLVLAMVNGTPQTCTRTVHISGIDSLKLTESVKFLATDPLKETISKSDVHIDRLAQRITVTIPSDSTLTLVLRIELAK